MNPFVKKLVAAAASMTLVFGIGAICQGQTLKASEISVNDGRTVKYTYGIEANKTKCHAGSIVTFVCYKESVLGKEYLNCDVEWNVYRNATVATFITPDVKNSAKAVLYITDQEDPKILQVTANIHDGTNEEYKEFDIEVLPFFNVYFTGDNATSVYPGRNYVYNCAFDGISDNMTVAYSVRSDSVSVNSKFVGNTLYVDQGQKGGELILRVASVEDPDIYDELPITVEANAIAINETNFPDPVFRAYVSLFGDNDGDKLLDPTYEIPNLTEIYFYEQDGDNIEYSKIKSFKGIEFFNNLQTLSIEKAPKLEKLDLSQNTELNWLSIGNTGITSLDVSQNLKLNTLDLYDGKIKSLDLSSNTNLTELFLSNQPLGVLKMPDAPAMMSIMLNQLEITTFDVSKYKNLVSLDIGEVPLKSLDVSKNTKLDILNVGYSDITSFDVTKNTKLTSLSVYNVDISELDVSKCIYLTCLDVSGTKLTALDISDLKDLDTLYVFDTDIDVIDIRNNSKLIEAYKSGEISELKNRIEYDYTRDESTNYALWIDKETRLIVDDPVYVLVTVSDKDLGTVEGAGLWEKNSDVTLKAVPAEGAKFIGWKQGDKVVSDKLKMSFKATVDVSYIAVFEKEAVTPVPSTATPTVTPVPTGKADDLIRGFVDRIYKYVLDREPEEDGAKFWTEELYNFKRTGAEVAQGFIFSPEFENRKTSDKEFVTILYKTFFGRDPEDDGMKYWLNQLSTGTMDRVTVANGFIFSKEWADTCAEYGIRSGGDIKSDKTIKPTDLTYAFVERMYTTAMKRDYDKEGREYWAGLLANFETTGEAVGACFFLSQEMEDYKLSDAEFLNRLYATFMDRESDADGAAYWLGVMASGTPRADVVFGFTRSPEFTEKCVEARILPY